MDFGTAVKYVLAVIGIMLVAGGIIFALSGVVLNMFEKKDKSKTVVKAKEVEKTETLLLEDSKEPVLVDEPAKEVAMGDEIDMALAEQERRSIETSRNELKERERIVEQAIQNQEEDEEDINAIYERMIAEINAEANAQTDAEPAEEPAEEPIEDDQDEDVYNIDELMKTLDSIAAEEPTEQPAEESAKESAQPEQPVAQEVVEEVVEVAEEEQAPAEVEEPTEQAEAAEEVEEEVVEETEQAEVTEEIAEQAEVVEPLVDEEKEELKKQIEALRMQLEQEQEHKTNLERLVEQEQQEKSALIRLVEEAQQSEILDAESVDMLNDRLVVLNDRLAKAEKDFKANKKEYLPLLRIKKTLENDKAKLRRKEAMVAKQQVVLFGVNNYVEDPEKEKKLSEDLDMLDALRLSVQHCEEVIKQNEDRYPILEKTHNILTKQIEDLKLDIQDIKERIARATANGNN